MQQLNSDKLSVLVEPTLDEAKELIEKAFVQRRTLIIAGNCSVDYVGRANSKLGLGERFLVIKTDGSLLVHRPTCYEPVNWQSPGSVFHTQIVDDVLEVQAVRQKPKENVKVLFSKIFTVTAIMLFDAGDFVLNASEEDMHKAILFKPDLIEDGFKPVSWEKHVEPGFVDVYGMDKLGRLVVIEVKRKVATREAVLQLARYIEAIKHKADRPIRGILAAPILGKGVQELLVDNGLEFKELCPKKCATILKKENVSVVKLEQFFGDSI